MSSFKRRPNPASASSAAPLPAGVKPSSFTSPVPLISTGIPALDDLLSGGGLFSSSDLLILPSTGTAAQSAAQIGASCSTPAASAETDHAARAAAEPYVELLLGYSIAQGIASGHTGVVIGEDVCGLVGGLMARAGDLDEQLVARLGSTSDSTDKQEEEVGPSERLNAVADDDADEPQPGLVGPEDATSEGGKATDPQREREMKIAWRYHSMKQFNTTVNEPSSEPIPFCQTFDLSKRIDSRIVNHAVEQSKLELVDISTATEAAAAQASDGKGINSYEIAYTHIEAAAEKCRREASAQPTTAPPVLRIAIRALGSPAWTVPRGSTRPVEVIRFLRRLKCLLRSLSLDNSRPIPSMAVLSLSPQLLSCPSINLPHRLLHSVDAAISLSAFSSSPSLRSAFPSYTGAFKILKTPSVGTLTNPSIRSSVLRGMGTGSSSGKTGGGEGGAGGGENNLAFKVRRKRLVIETLHLDVEGGVSERRTKPAKGTAGEAVKKVAGPSAGSRVEGEAASAGSFEKRRPTVAAEVAATTDKAGAGPKKFTGLSSLRQRGLAAAVAASGAPPPKPKEYTVELDSAPSQHQHNHSAPPANTVANTRAQDLEF